MFRKNSKRLIGNALASRGKSAVNRQRLPGDETGSLRGQEQKRANQLFRLSYSAHGSAFAGPIEETGDRERRLSHFAGKPSWGQCVDSHPAIGPAASQIASQINHRSLGRLIGRRKVGHPSKAGD